MKEISEYESEELLEMAKDYKYIHHVNSDLVEKLAEEVVSQRTEIDYLKCKIDELAEA